MPHMPLLEFWLTAGFNAIMQPLYSLVSGLIVGFHWLFSRFLDPNAGLTWVLSIIALTFLVRTLMIPLMMRQLRSTRNMQTIQPKIQELQKKYAHDRERMGQETMKLYREEGVNPMASCLMPLLQIPIFWALFTVLNGVARGHAEGIFLKARPHLVESLGNAEFLGVRLSHAFLPMKDGHVGATQIMAGLLVLGLVVSLFITQLSMMRRNMPPESLNGPMAQNMKMMMYIFPLTYFFTGGLVPIGVLIYWLTSNLWTLAQQEWMIRHNPTPNTPAYVDWEERMRAKGLDPKQIEADRRSKRRGTPATVTAEPGRVQRQNLDQSPTKRRQTVTRQATTTETTTASESASEGGSTVVRQQPRKQTRSVRRKK